MRGTGRGQGLGTTTDCVVCMWDRKGGHGSATGQRAGGVKPATCWHDCGSSYARTIECGARDSGAFGVCEAWEQMALRCQCGSSGGRGQ